MEVPWSCILVCTISTVFILGSSSSSLASSPLIEAYPSSYGDECNIVVPPPPKREVYGKNGRIIDITHEMRPDLPIYGSPEGVGQLLRLAVSPVLLVDVPRNMNITAEAMESLNIPRGVRRVIFRTLNTDRLLMYKSHFDTSYVGFTQDGAQWLKDHTDIKMVGVDYLSVASWDDNVSAHLVFLEGRDIIIVEGLKLDGIDAGLYSSVHCLPLRLVGAEGSPIRCILIK
ncbi:hypothetical protein MKW92_026134 [Papaver armeniacum]|nr:hypothetical protein MKW92_026134 [Papaver armeniacum]